MSSLLFDMPAAFLKVLIGSVYGNGSLGSDWAPKVPDANSGTHIKEFPPKRLLHGLMPRVTEPKYKWH